MTDFKIFKQSINAMFMALALLFSLPSLAMNKAELVDAIASNANLSKADAKRALDGFVTTTTSSLKKGNSVQLIGFGSFSISKRAARTGRNPQTGATIKVKAKYGDGLSGSIQVLDDGRTEFFIDLDKKYLLENDRVHFVPEVDDKVLSDLDLPDEYIFELPANTQLKKKRKLRKVHMEYEIPTAALTGQVGQDGITPLFDGPDALLAYLPASRPDVSDTSVAAGDLVEAAEALGYCDDAFVDLERNDIAMQHGHVTVLKIMSGQTGLTFKQLESFFDSLTNLHRGIEKSDIRRGMVIAKPGKTKLVGFGTFSISKRAARTGRNPQTGKEIKIKAKKVAKFKAGKALADTVK